MKKREKMLALVVGSLALLFAGYFAASYIFIKPLQTLERQTALLRDKLRQIQDDRRAFFGAEDYVKRAAQNAFGPNADIATAQAGKMLSDLIQRLGLAESEFVRTPVGPRKMRGAQEVGWNIQGEGPLPKIIDFLFELDQCPQIHRLENLVFSAGDKPARVKVRLRFLTLVVDGAPDVAPISLKPKFTLASPERRAYDAIVQRDLLQPFSRRVPPDTALAATDGASPSAVRPEMLKVVSLSEWKGAPEVHVLNLSSMSVQVLKPGDPWAGGRIVMVDYRTKPLRGKPDLLSFSRVIFRVGSEFWAVEQGQTLAEKYPLASDALPPGLPKL